MWSSTDRATTYTISNHCAEDLLLTPSRGTAIALPARATLAVRTVDQEPTTTFIVSRPDGTASVQVQVGTPIIDLEDDDCPTDR